jgi:hypothetical protein
MEALGTWSEIRSQCLRGLSLPSFTFKLPSSLFPEIALSSEQWVGEALAFP